jgi:alpha-L-fucosidase
MELGWPSGSETVIHSLGSSALNGQKIASIALLGSDAKLTFQQQPDGLRVQLPAQAPGKYAYVFRATFERAGP